MLALRAKNKTFRQIADAMGYKSPSTVSELLSRRGHFSIVLNRNEVTALLKLLQAIDFHTAPDELFTIIEKLNKIEGK